MEEMLEILQDLRGVEFKEFTRMDWACYAGADEGSKIGSGEKFVFIIAPTGNLTVIDEDGTETEIGVLSHTM